MHPLLRANQNTVWGGLIVETLAHCGLRRAIISPGSRSTPLTVAFALEDRVDCTVMLDERSAAFFALGCAKASGEPVALVCTSGTAAANYLPAIIEAHYSGAPLIVLTADRPPELRDCASGQTIDQVKLYGDYAGFYHELSLPPMEPQLGERHDYLIRLVTHAFGVAATLKPGPVHLNVPFRDPLAPVEGKLGGPFPAINKTRLPFSSPVAEIERKVDPAELPFFEREDLLVVAGAPDGAPANEDLLAVARLCAQRGWPLLADAASGLRGYAAECGSLVRCYDSILREPVARHELRPGALLFIGQLPTSKILRSYLRENARLPSWRLGAGLLNLNASYGPVQVVPVRPRDLRVEKAEESAPTPLGGRWLDTETAERRRLKKHLRDSEGLFEGRLPDVLAGALPPNTPVFLASSMPVRDAEYFWPVNKKTFGMVVNRGANGIDGTLSTALGVAAGSRRPAVLVTGDLALLHDQNGLLAAPEFKGGLTVFLINNQGGGIFENLPIADFEPPFERFFATPQNVDFAKLAAAHGLEHHRPNDWEEVAKLARKLPRAGIRLVEIRADRTADAKTRQVMLNRS